MGGAQGLQVAAILCALAAIPTVATAQNVARGTVFVDQDGDGRYDPGEPSLPGVRVSNGRDVVPTGEDGRYELPIDDDDIIFVIKPRGYMTPVDARNLPRFYYIHKPAGSPTALKYAGVAPTGPLPESIDFPLLRRDEPDAFRVLVFGDPQPGTIEEVDYFAQDIVQEVIGMDAAFGVSLGDIVNDDLALFAPMAATVGLVGIPWYHVYGNHDQNYDVESDALADETWERLFGPPTYAFDWGPVHFIVVDDVMYDGHIKKYRSHAAIGPHLAFIENDLKHVSKDQLVVLMMHIPIVGENGVQDKEKLFALLSDRPHTFSLASHWHIQQQFFVGAEDGWTGERPHHHLVQGASCGSWWNGAEDEWGLPHTMMRDGVPNGYSIITFNGNQYSIRFKAARRSADEQMAIHAPGSVATTQTGSTEVLANVYAGTDRSVVEMRVGRSQPWQPMKQAERTDPLFVAAHASEQGLDLAYHQNLPKPRATPHIWVGHLPAGLALGTHLIEVRTRDMFDQVSFGRRVIRVEPPLPPYPVISLEKTNPDLVRLLSYNMLWDGLFDRPEPFKRILRALSPDIICFQEVNSSAADVAAQLDDILPLGESQWQAFKSRGPVIASRWPLSMQAADTIPTTDRGQPMALVDLPDDRYDVDLYVISAHLKCCGSEGGPEDLRRQTQADANINWFRELRQPGGSVELPAGTPFVIAGDFNMVGGLQPLHTLLDGNIINEDIYGADSPPDWDGSDLTDLHPRHNAKAADFTWRSEGSPYPPGRLDFALYTDSVMCADKSFVLDTVDMDPAALTAHGLLRQDCADASDHLPLVVDFALGDRDGGGDGS
jgi:endonuclease/exonuclease/phosphatase family metal-dependent hydrolase